MFHLFVSSLADIPVFPTITATVTFQEFRYDDFEESIFFIPPDYKEDPSRFPDLWPVNTNRKWPASKCVWEVGNKNEDSCIVLLQYIDIYSPFWIKGTGLLISYCSFCWWIQSKSMQTDLERQLTYKCILAVVFVKWVMAFILLAVHQLNSWLRCSVLLFLSFESCHKTQPRLFIVTILISIISPHYKWLNSYCRNCTDTAICK